MIKHNPSPQSKLSCPLSARRAGVAILLLVACRTATAQTETRTESFDRPPRWESYNNHVVPAQVPTVTQDFGYSRTSHAGGETGEIGGQIWRSTRPAYYAMPTKPLTLNDPLHMAGTFSLPKSDGSSGVFFGWFAARKQLGSGRPVSSLGIYLDAEGTGARMYAGVLTQTNRGHLLWETDFFVGRANPPIKPDGKPRTFDLTYDPNAAGGRGELTLVFDGKPPVKTELPEGFKQEGATFDHFGLSNLHKGGRPLTLYLDELTINGESLTFDTDPQWEEQGNRETFEDDIITGAHNFGYRETNHAGGGKGELGGIFWRAENPFAYVADRIETLTLDKPLAAAGKVAFTTGAMDAGMFIGWFNSQSKDLPYTELRNICGIYVEGPTRIGHYFRPIAAAADGQKADADQGPVILPNGKPRTWSLRYDPSGNGEMVVTLDDETFRYPLPEGFRKRGATFDRFGVFTSRAGGSHVEIFFDDLTYTARQ